jgi:hypothetical protein
MDRVLDYALWLTIRELEPYWMPEFQAGKLTFGGDAKKLAFALSAVGNKDAVKPVVALIDSGKVPNENVQGLWLLLTQIGGPDELGKVLTHISAKNNVSPTQRIELIQAVEDAAKTRRIGPPRELPVFSSLLNFNASVSCSTLKLIGLWKINTQRKVLESTASTPSEVPPELRMAALDGLAFLGDADARKMIVGLCSANKAAETRRFAIIALASLDPNAAATQAVEFLSDARPEPNLLDVYTAFLSRKAGVPGLAKALAGKKLNPGHTVIDSHGTRSRRCLDQGR